METIKERMRNALKSEELYYEQTAEKCEAIVEEVAIKLLNWLSNKESRFSILYEGTPGLDKDYRFSSLEEDYTSKELFQIFKTTKHTDKQ